MTTLRSKGLLPLPPDARDFSHAAVFGSVSSNDLPTNDFLVAVPLELKNQDINYPSDFCTLYANSECAEDMEQVVFVPEWTFAKIKARLAQAEGSQAYQDSGLDLRNACQGAIDFGFLPRIYDPFGCDTAYRPARDYLVHPENWGADLDSIAFKYRLGSYFSVNGPHDMFDNIRSVMWQHLEERRSVTVGALWRESWSTAPSGIIPKTYEAGGTGHAFKICGQKTINGELHLIAQLSDGPAFGDNGYFYFPREVVNKEIGPFGCFTFSHLPPDSAAWHITHGVTVYDSLALKVIKFISNLIKI